MSVSGEIDASNAKDIDSRVEPLFARRHDVIIDLAAVSFIGSCGLWVVVGLPQVARTYGVGCAVVTNDTVDRLLHVVNHCRPPWVFDDRSSATDALATEGLWLAS
ncbi:STAS domain-containing protein [Tsukamurella soli]|uniref:STAS domain-containing protein n=1 Tax=Tsukamurella soli TaxID=644556 RepID=UPI0031EBBB79